MDKQEVLLALRGLILRGDVSKEEVNSLFLEASPDNSIAKKLKKIGIAEVLYLVGALIIVVGVIILIVQNWDNFSSAIRILVTLGPCIAAYVVGVLFSRYESLDGVSQAFFAVSGMLAPLAVFVTFDSAGLDPSTMGMQSLIALMLMLVYGASFLLFRNNVFLVFALGFATWLFFVFIQFIIKDAVREFSEDIWRYQIIVAGLSYMLLGYAFSNTKRKPLTSVLYTLGVIGFLGSTITFGGVGEILFPGFVFGVLLLSVYLKSKSFLVFGALFLIGYIIKITAVHFGSVLGWPVALIIAGLLIIAIGYGSIYLNKKYISKRSV